MFKWLRRQNIVPRRLDSHLAMISSEMNPKFSEESLREFENGDLIFMEGDDSREMYVLVEGEVQVFKNSGGQDVLLSTMRKGDFVGEMSLLESLPRSATARAKGHTKLLVIQPGGFLLKIRRDPTFAFEIMQALSKRIRVTNENLVRELSRGSSSNEALKAILSGVEYPTDKKISPSLDTNTNKSSPASVDKNAAKDSVAAVATKTPVENLAHIENLSANKQKIA
jgi:CRP/FNR family transcriptional regulator, cyclic AMP receptor protein